MDTHFLMLLPLSWAFPQPVDISLLTLLRKPGSFTYAQPRVKFYVTLHPKLSTWDTYLFNSKLEKWIFLSKSYCDLINVDFFGLHPYWPRLLHESLQKAS